MVANNEQIIRDFIAAWSRLDVEELVQYFCEDGTYHNMPTKPVTGHEALRPFISAFLKDWRSTEWDVLNLMSNGNIVFAERLDRTVVGSRPVNLPCCGVFEMQNGRIKVWRDYFDIGTYVSALRD
ncbi:limonene-1,2-epoxide hydrolase family protein [Phenylobacterium sp.]|jgi:limonene-1,2-epoxide hydrolase|uniref:limonene-1,2-epoxide hydrolase family protein n=1 Tax=Phenylobacterium sp. TaxID=1871053 RepID=UPI0035B417ED